MSANATRFGRIVSDRRGALDLTQVEVWDRRGPSNSTLTAIESGRWKRYAATFRKLDTALEWEPGSARRVFDDGGDPIPIVAPQPKPAAAAGDLTDDELLAELTYRMKRYAALNAKERDQRERDAAANAQAGGSPASGKVVIPETPQHQAASLKPQREPRQ